MAATRTVAFVTIGQSPRPDMVPEMLGWIGPGVTPIEVGALDGLDRAAIASLAPRPGERHLICRLPDGAEVVLGQREIGRRLQVRLDELDARGVFLVVVLCTGHFEGVRSKTLMVEAQRVIDHAVDALSEDGRSVGVLVPLREQMTEHSLRSDGRRTVLYSHASPYSGDRLDQAAGELAGADLVVMHCMGYTEAMRRCVAAITGKPVLLARRVVADAVAQLL
jgi:protein AroM